MQVSAGRSHDQPVPAIAVAVSPAGSVSATLTDPVLVRLPLFVAVRVYTAPVWPRTKSPECVFESVMSGPFTLTVLSAVVVGHARPSRVLEPVSEAWFVNMPPGKTVEHVYVQVSPSSIT